MSSKQVRAGGAYVELGLRDRIDKGLAAAKKKLNAFGKGALVAGGAAIGTAGSIVAPLIMAASSAAETASKFDTVFGSQSDTIRQWGNDFADSIGRSRTQIESFMSGTQDLLVPIGFDSASATELSKTITGLTIDLASFNNKADADVMNDLQAALTGSGEVMKKYGVILSEAAVKQELLNQGIDPKKVTEQQKVQARMNIILAGTTAAQGDATRTAGGWANQMKTLQAMASNLAVTIGNYLLPPATFLISMINRGARVALDFAENNKKLIGIVLGGVTAIGAMGGLLMAAGGAAIAGSFAIGLLSTGLGVLGSILAFVTGPALLVVGAIAAIGAAAYYYRDAIGVFAQEFWNQVAPVREAMAAIWDVVSTTFEGIKGALSAGDFTAAANILWAGLQAAFFTGAEHAAKAFEWLFGSATGWLKGIGDAILTGNFALAFDIVWAQIKVTFTAGTTAVSKTWTAFTEGLGEVFDSMATGVRSAFLAVAQYISGILQSAADKLRDLLNALAEYDPTGLAAKAAEGYGTISLAMDFAGKGLGAMQEEEEAARIQRRLDRYKATAERMDAADQKLANAKRNRDELIAKAAANAEGVSLGGLAASKLADLRRQVDAFKDEGAVDAAAAEEAEGQQQAGLNRGAKASKQNAGSFSAMGAALLGLGGGGPAEETAKNTKRSADLLQRLLNKESAPPTFS